MTVRIKTSEISQDVIEEWTKSHIKERGISLIRFEIVEIDNLLHPHEYSTSTIFLSYSKKQLHKLIDDSCKNKTIIK